MADQPQDPRDDRRGEGVGDPDRGLDQTAPFDPIRDDDPAGSGTEPRPKTDPPTSGPDDAATAVQSGPPRPDDAPTRIEGGPLATDAAPTRVHGGPSRADDAPTQVHGGGASGTDAAPTRRYRGFTGTDGPPTRAYGGGPNGDASASRGGGEPTETYRAARDEPQRPDRTADQPTVVGPGDGDDRTTRIQNVGPRNATPPEDRAWAGRAGVPQPGGPGGPGGPPGDGPPPPDDWQPRDPAGGRRWWMPILVGVIALVLLGVLAFGLWLILRGDGSADPTPTPTPTTAAPTTARPTTAAPTTTAPSPTATTPTAVPVPDVEGLTVLEAGEALSDVGLSARLSYVDSDQPAGTVIATNPEIGTEVKTGATITLIVSTGRTTAPTTEPPTSPPPTSTPAVPPGPR